MRHLAIGLLLSSSLSNSLFAADFATSIALLDAPKGITAVAGQVVDEKGLGLPNVRVSDNTESTFTSPTGSFLLQYVPSGKSVLRIDGRHSASGFNVDYGIYEIPVRTLPGKTLRLPFKNWLTKIDHTHDVTILSPTTAATIIQTPAIPGFELILGPDVVVKDIDGKAVTKVSITPVAGDKLPFPLPGNAPMQQTFSIQPGAACLYTASGGVGSAQIYYPNVHHQLPRAREGLLRFEPDQNGWGPYGTGTVANDGQQVIPDKSTYITDFGSAECDKKTRSHIQILKRQPTMGLVR